MTRQFLPDADQRLSAMRRQIEPPDHLLPAGFRRLVKVHDRLGIGLGAIGFDRLGDHALPGVASAESQRFPIVSQRPRVIPPVALQIAHRRSQARTETADESERLAIRELRKHLLWYTRGRRGGVHFRRDAGRLLTAADVAQLLDEHFPEGGDAFGLDPAFRPDEEGE